MLVACCQAMGDAQLNKRCLVLLPLPTSHSHCCSCPFGSSSTGKTGCSAPIGSSPKTTAPCSTRGGCMPSKRVRASCEDVFPSPRLCCCCVLQISACATARFARRRALACRPARDAAAERAPHARPRGSRLLLHPGALGLLGLLCMPHLLHLFYGSAFRGTDVPNCTACWPPSQHAPTCCATAAGVQHMLDLPHPL